ncbi:mannitol-1-phosphate 5-dehydrogenase, partial [Bacillus cereus]|nr:mannitol-1-phosphate 5-dehydrogenase [Bacillus cereus]
MIALHFGAGNIGRGFIGALLCKSGYDVVFADVNDAVINELNDKGRYTVEMADAG